MECSVLPQLLAVAVAVVVVAVAVVVGCLQVDAHRVGEFRWEFFDRVGSSSPFRTDSCSVCDSPGRLLRIAFSR